MKQVDKLLAGLLVVAAAAAIFQVLALCRYAFPHADDIVHIVNLQPFANQPRIAAASRVAWNIYMTSDSRWAASFLNHMAIGGADAYTRYPKPLLIFASIPMAGLFALFAGVLEMGFIRSLCATVILYGILLASYPSLTEAVYWLNSSIQYSFGLTCALVLFALIRAVPRNWISTALLSPLILFAGATHEYTAAAMELIFAAICWNRYAIRAPDRKRWFWFSAVALLGLISIIFAPGNLLRVQDQPLRTLHGIAMAEFVLKQPFSSIPRWLGASPFILGAFLWGRWIVNLKLPAWLENDYARRCIPLITAALALMSVVGAPLLGGYQAGRALNWGYFIVVIGVMLSTAANRAWVARELKIGRAPYLAAIVCLACSLIFASNIELARRGLSQPLNPWRSAMIQRMQVSSAGDIVLPGIARPTPILPTYGLLFEKDHWLNRAYAQFLHVRSVVADTACEPNQ